mgnify:CR=1 FL=1
MCIQVQQITYIHPDKEVLFRNLSFTVGKGRQLALIGNNGCGKSTLLQIMAGKLQPSSGNVLRPDDLYYVPQHFGQYDEMSIAQALGIDRKQKALHEILNGNASIDHFNILDDDWNIEEKALAALNGWGLGNRSLSESMHTLSGGEKTRVFLAGLELQEPSAILMDEPTNHLDNQGRNRLYEWVKKCRSTLIVVSRTCVLRRQLRILQAAERTATERPATTTGRERKRTPPNTKTGTRSSRTKRKAEYTERKISA